MKKKRSKSRKKTTSSGKKSVTGSRRFIWLNLLAGGFFVSILAFAFYLFYLDQQIQQRFSGDKWSLPARVYARPLELFIGKPFSFASMQQQLRDLGYTKTNDLSEPGRYNLQNNSILIHTREFAFWDGKSAAERLRIDFQNDHVTSISRNNSSVAYIRLEPELIGKIYPLHKQDRVLVDYDAVPQSLVDALLAVEDRNFFSHPGIDLKGILRALVANVRSAGLVQGGSTLTQQLVKNFFLTPDRTLIRKVNELFMALILEHRYSKPEILSAYINEVYLGQDGASGIHGFGTAAEFYFARPLAELSTAEIALLVGMVKGASYYHPVRNTERALQRRNLVLDTMQQLGYLNAELASQARKEKLRLRQQASAGSSLYRDFLELVRIQLLKSYRYEDLRNEGLLVFTTLDTRLQKNVVRVVSSRLAALEKTGNETDSLQAAVIISTVDTGDVLALTGGRNSSQSGYNRALNSSRQIGSLIKPFIYLAALLEDPRINPLTMINDVAVSIPQNDGEQWQPSNYDNKEHGRVTLMEALVRSYNLATVNLGMQIGLKPIIRILQRAGFDAAIKPYPSLLLGAVNMTPLQVSQLYQVLASGGFKSNLNTLQQVLTHDGKPLQKIDVKTRRVVDPDAVAVVNSILAAVVTEGTARGLRAPWNRTVTLAGKTGTTNNLRDSWFAGFDANTLGVVWVGKDDNSSSGLTGASGAMRVWADIMQTVSLNSLEKVTLPNLQWHQVKSIQDDCVTPLSIAFLRSHQPDINYLCQ